MANGGKQFAGNSNNSFFTAAPFFKSQKFVFKFEVLVRFNDSKSNLKQERFQISTGATNTSSFLLA